jgi:hypothetical protein
MAWSVLLVAVSILQDPPLSARPPQPEAIAEDQTPRPTNAPDSFRLEDVTVVGRRGSTDLTPEREFGAAEIDVLGAYDISDVIRRLSQNMGLSEFPEVIVNGRRALNPADFLGFPPDAMVRVEVLPPEAGALYSDDPSRRVLNIVLQREFKSRDGLLAGSRPTASGRSSVSGDIRQSEIHDDSTRQFGLRLSRDTPLRAEEREAYSRDHPGSAGTTLRPAADAATVNGSLTGALGDWSGSLNGTTSTSDSRFVFRVDDQTIETRQGGRDLTLAGALGGEVLGWSTQMGMDGGVSSSRQSGIAQVRSQALRFGANVRGDRTVMELPAGPLRANLSSRFWYARTRTDVDTDRKRQSTESLDVTGNLSIPLTRRVVGGDEGGGGVVPIGDLSATLGGSVRGLYGATARGEGVNVGLNWSPIGKVRLNAMWASSVDSPTNQQRFDPVVYGPPQTVFDFQTGEAVEILPLLGGNPDLGQERSRNLSLSASAGPYTAWNLMTNLSFRQARSTDDISALPALTPEIEAAFPDRFIRNGDGRLLSIDQRPLNLGSTLAETLSSSLNFSVPFSDRPTAETPYLQVALSHTWQLTNQLVLHESLPVLDRLAGDGGGLPRHQVSFRLDGRYRKVGLNAGVNWNSASRIRRDAGRDGPGDLRLSPFSTIDLRLSYLFERPTSPGEDGAGSRRDSGLRAELEVSNLFDARPEATVGGVSAPGYGRDDQDPLGRTIRLTLSRRF